MFLTETHLHTNFVSPCALVSPTDAVEAYIRSGYKTIVITDHFKGFCRSFYKKENDREWIDHFLSGYRTAKQVAGDQLNVLLGMEICFDQNCNDYLVYGLEEESFYAHPDMYSWGIQRFHEVAAAQGWLVIQAHPFRNHMSITSPEYLDGIEVYNGNPRHDSRNDIASMWADKFNLLKTSGSDFHEMEDLARGGIITEHPIETQAQLIEAIRQGAPLHIQEKR